MKDISLYSICGDPSDAEARGESIQNSGSEGSSADEQLRGIVELTRLYDTYGPLLSDHNRVIFEDYVLNNYSLAEIASDQGLTRQGVRDVVLRCSKKLRDYESRLGMLSRLDLALEMLDSLEGYIEGSEGISMATKLKKLLEG